MSQLRFRRKEKKYTEVYNTIIFKNKNVELTGLYTTIQACIDLEINTRGTDKEFVLSKKTLQHYCGYKDDKFKRIWNELKTSGYLKQYKIKGLNGKFYYEYELLDEPDLTLHHSLIQNEDGSLMPNIPQSKIEKLINNDNEKPGVENPPLEPGVDFPHSGEIGGYYNTLSNKVSMYVSIAKEKFDLTNANKEFIKSIELKIDFDLFEEILVYANNKNKTFRYVKSTIEKIIEKGISTLEAYEKDIDSYKKTKTANKKQKANPVKSSKEMTREEIIIQQKRELELKAKKNKAHNVNASFTGYTPDELERHLQEMQRSKFR